MKLGKKRNAGTRLLGLLLSMTLFLGGVLSAAQPAYADGRITTGRKVYTYASHGRLEDSFAFSIGDGVVTVENIPQRLVAKAKYISAYVALAGRWEDDKFIFQEPYKSIYVSHEVTAPHSIPLPTEEGVYSLSVHVTGTDGSAESYTHHFTIEDGDAFFRLTANYDNNEKKFKKRYTGKAALWAFTRYYENEKYSKKKEIIKKTAEKIVAPGDSDYEKARKVHDWVAENIWYDMDYYLKRTDTTELEPTAVLESKKTVCDGYARLTMALLCSLGIPARYILAHGAGGPHAWNEVYVDGRWVLLDTTLASNNRYENGSFSEAKPCNKMDFDQSLAEFSELHYYYESDGHGGVRSALLETIPETQKLTLKQGQTKQFSLKTLDKSLNLKDLSITYSSGNKKVATVSKSGKVKGIEAGTATIKVKIMAKEPGKKALAKKTLVTREVKVTVKK